MDGPSRFLAHKVSFYQSSRHPSIHAPFTLKHEYRCNLRAGHNQISSEASIV